MLLLGISVLVTGTAQRGKNWVSMCSVLSWVYYAPRILCFKYKKLWEFDGPW